MILKARSNPQKYNVNAKKLHKLEKYLGQLYTNILSGNLFEIYMNGVKEKIRTETKPETVFKNKTFKDKYLEYIKWKIEAVQVKLSNPGDMKAANSYFNLLVNYAVYRNLFADEDSKIYKKIWSLQKLCPVIILYNNLSVNPGVFLSKKVPLKKATKTDPVDIEKFLFTELQQRDAEFPNKVESNYVRLVQWIIKMNSDAL